MKKGSFKNLLLCEYFLIKKPFKFGMLFFLAFAGFGILAALSKEYGNLALILSLVSEMEAPAEIAESINGSIDMIIRLMPALAACCVNIHAVEATAKGEEFSQRCFKKTTPVSSFRRALVKTVSVLCSMVVSLLCAFGYMTLIGVLTGRYPDKAESGVLIMFAFVFLCINVLAMLAVTFFHSMDKGMLFTTGLLFVTVGVCALQDEIYEIYSKINGVRGIYELLKGVLPFVPVLFLFMFGILLGTMTLLYHRKEA